MILDLPRFVTTERVYWNELQAVLDRLSLEPNWNMSISILCWGERSFSAKMRSK